MIAPFQVVLRVREKLYAAGVLRSHRLNHPVISIGNLTLGGTGKTPLTIFLAQQMHAAGFRPIILSRGYKRKSRGTVVVSRGKGPQVAWQDAGDEPFLMARRLTGVASVVVGESRYLAGARAEQEGLGDLFLLDDGFQHRQLYRDVDLVTIDPAEWQAGERLIPAGRWREPRSALARAHAACIRQSSQSEALRLPIPCFDFSVKPDGLRFRQQDIRAAEWRHKSVTAFAGIAKPERFFAELDALGIPLRRRLSFPDHHPFSDAELADLRDEVTVTTEKDAVKLEGRGDFATLKVSVTMTEFDRLRNLILDRLANATCR